MNSIRFRVHDLGRHIYVGRKTREYSMKVSNRPTLTAREAQRKKYGLPMNRKPEALNRQVITRVFGRVHTFQGHSPPIIRTRHKQMWLRWDKKMDRRGVSTRYTNTFSLHSFL